MFEKLNLLHCNPIYILVESREIECYFIHQASRTKGIILQADVEILMKTTTLNYMSVKNIYIAKGKFEALMTLRI